MKNKVLKILVMIIILFSMLYVPMPTAQASLMGAIRGECPSAPGSSRSPNVSGGSVGGGRRTETVTTIEIIGYEKISGTVQEDFGYGLNSGKYKLPIEGVIVELVDASSNKVVSSIRTDSSGAYSFSPPDGTYSVRYRYGDLDGKEYNEEYEKQILKYNGYDYYALSTKRKDYFGSQIKSSITTSGKSCAQIMIALDISTSMREPIIVNGERTTRLKIAVESTKKLIHELLASGENIYVGLVTFSGDSDILCGLTNDEWILLDKLNEIEKVRIWTWTNQKRALEACEYGFVNKDKDDANRTIVLISDGIPTCASTSNENTFPSSVRDVLGIYSNDSDWQVNSKLNSIKSYTNQTVKRLKDDGIRLVSLFTEATQEENDFVEDMLGKQSDLFSFMKDGDETIKKLTTNLKEYLMTVTTEKKDYDPNYITVGGGDEDKERRKEVDANFTGRFYYDHKATEGEENTIRTSLFQCNTDEDRDELSRLASMWGWIGRNYQIRHVEEHTEIETHDRTVQVNGHTQCRTETIITIYKKGEYKEQDVSLQLKELTFNLETEVTATNLEVILSDGKILSRSTIKCR